MESSIKILLSANFDNSSFLHNVTREEFIAKAYSSAREKFAKPRNA
jgi:hypothetical protein